MSLTSLDAFHLPSLFNMGASVPDSAVVGSSVAIVVVDMVGRSVVMSLPLPEPEKSSLSGSRNSSVGSIGGALVAITISGDTVTVGQGEMLYEGRKMFENVLTDNCNIH